MTFTLLTILFKIIFKRKEVEKKREQEENEKQCPTIVDLTFGNQQNW